MDKSKWAPLVLVIFILTACSVPGTPSAATAGSSTQPVEPVATIPSVAQAVTPSSSNPDSAAPVTVTLGPNGEGDYPDLLQAVAGVPAGSTILLAAGTYQVTDFLDIKKTLTISGAGMDSTIVTTTLGEDAFGFYGPGTLTLSDLTFQYAGTEPSDVFLVDNAAVQISRCRFTGGIQDTGASAIGYGVGLFIQGESSGSVSDSIFDNNQSGGMVIIDNSTITLQGNNFNSNGSSGLTLRGSYSGLVDHNTADNNKFNGIVLMDITTATLIGNSTYGNVFSGIVYSDDSAGSAWENDASGNGYHGFSVQNQAHPLLEKNICNGNTYDGIAYFDTAYGTVRANTCNQNYGNGLSASNNSSPVFENNITSYNDSSGIAFYAGSGGSASANTCAYNGWGIYVEKGAAPALGVNTVYGNTTVDILDERE